MLACLLIPWSRVLLEKPTGSQLVKKLYAFYVTRRFITAFRSALHLSLSWASSIQSVPLMPLREYPYCLPVWDDTQYGNTFFHVLLCWNNIHLNLHEERIEIHEYCEKIVPKLTDSIKTRFFGAFCNYFVCNFFLTKRVWARNCLSSKFGVWLTVHRNSVWIRKTN